MHCFTAGISSPSLHRTGEKIIIYFSLSGQVCFCLQREERRVEELSRLGFLTVDCGKDSFNFNFNSHDWNFVVAMTTDTFFQLSISPECIRIVRTSALQRRYYWIQKTGSRILFLVLHYSTLLHLPPLRFHCVRG